MKPKYWWIKEWNNPQHGGAYVAMGPLFVKDAKKHEGAGMYGYNIMYRYSTEAAYLARLQQLKDQGHVVRVGDRQWKNAGDLVTSYRNLEKLSGRK